MTAVLEVLIGSTVRTVATFDRGLAVNTQDQFATWSLNVTGTTITAKLGTATTVTGTLTSAEVAAITGWDQVAVVSTDNRYRDDYIVVKGCTSTGSGSATLPGVLLYEGGAPGQTTDYQRTRIAAITRRSRTCSSSATA